MSSPVYRIHHLLSRVLAGVRVGTNLDLFLLLWALLSGRFLGSRGAVFPALADFGLPDDAVRRAAAALARGDWTIADLIERFGAEVISEGEWQVHETGGYHPVAGDLTAFYRPCLKECPTKHYCAEAGKALPAIRMGLLVRVGSVRGERRALPVAIVRSDPIDPSEPAHRKRLLEAAKAQLTLKEVLTLDRGFPLAEVIGQGIERFVVRLPSNFTARRSTPPAYPGQGRPAEKGEIVRPLPRTYTSRTSGVRTIPATPPDRTEIWTMTEGPIAYELRADFWDDLVLRESTGSNRSDANRSEAEPVRFGVVAIHDPRFTEPLLLGIRPVLSGNDARSLYLDRWPVEGVPQAAKVMLGLGRQFVFGPESRHRLPEVALLGGSILSYLAATEPACAAGFWDRAPKPTAGRLRRLLATVHFDNLGAIPAQLRKKKSPTAHLPKGILGHRRRKRSSFAPQTLSLAA